MKKILFFSCMAAALLSFAGCEETGNDFEGTNYIYLEAKDGKSTMFETDSEPLVVDVVLTKALEEDLQITFELAGPEGVVELSGNPVTIKAGEKTASFSVVSLNANALESSASYRIGISSLLPEGVQLKEPLQFVVSPMSVEALTDGQKAIIDAYKTATGIDLSKYIGAVNVSAVITGTDPETYEPLEPQTITGKTVITLSESATAENPVLKMIANPMGIQDYMYGVFRSLTVDNEDWYSEYNLPCYKTLMDAISWTPTSAEVFGMSLDGISVDSEGRLSYVAEYVPDPEYPEDVYVHVPFEFSFTAYDREQTVIDSLKEQDPEWAYDCTSDPFVFLNNDDITEDWFSDEEEGLVGCWVETTGTVSNESMVFTFCMYTCDMDADYTRVVATYTPNN